ncbi:MAG: D-2-hydroxyacid dehydrogenase [Hespellia sp.]|jgi:lactate dehydrogenase-like 2-hydroxyacid dehydrogenase|nr:D-2-hydroxyacid dehydrogenase [Hespellia sp.]
MQIVFLDAKTIGDDIDLTGFQTLGEVITYDFTTQEEVPQRTKTADVLVINKVQINEQTIGQAQNLKLICVTATGTNNLDKAYLDRRGIAWRNVAGYSTESVTQHTFAMLFFLLEKLRYYDDYVKNGNYINDTIFTHFQEQFHQLSCMTWGIIGLGAIGRRVADLATAFGVNVIYYSASGAPAQKGYTQTDWSTILSCSDILSIHAPLNRYTEHLIDANALHQMKSSAILLNLGRGPIIVEADLADALEHHEIAAAGLDVLDIEPMAADNPLFRIKDSRRLLITPHIAWASVEARTKLMQIILEQIREFL